VKSGGIHSIRYDSYKVAKLGLIYLVVLFVSVFLLGNDISLNIKNIDTFSVDTRVGLMILGSHLTTGVNIAIAIISVIVTAIISLLEFNKLLKANLTGDLFFRLVLILQIIFTLALVFKCLTNLPSFGIGGVYNGV
jgi:hypothetical protein